MQYFFIWFAFHHLQGYREDNTLLLYVYTFSTHDTKDTKEMLPFTLSNFNIISNNRKLTWQETFIFYQHFVRNIFYEISCFQKFVLYSHFLNFHTLNFVLDFPKNSKYIHLSFIQKSIGYTFIDSWAILFVKWQ